METTATATIGELLAEEFPDGCTGEQAGEFMKRIGHSFGSPQAGLQRMGSNLGGGAGGGNNSSKVSKKSKVATGNLVRGRYK